MLTELEREQLVQGARAWGLILDAETVRRLERFAELLDEANRHLNLTRIPPEDFVTLHFLDSLALTAVLHPPSGARLIDVGTGAGFPGLPLAVALPDLKVTLLDGTRKRLDFLESVIADLRITNVRTLHGRAEEIARQPLHRASYDFATARAVAKLPELASWLLPLVRPGGQAVAYKSRDVKSEVEEAKPAIERTGGRLQRIVEVALPNTDIVRKLVVLSKVLATSSPRSARKGRS